MGPSTATAEVPMKYARTTIAFSAEVEIGSPPRKAKVMLDTGSSDAWIHSKFFEGSKSCEHTGQSFHLSYEKGAVTGEIVKDRLAIGGIDIPAARIGSAKSVDEVAVAESMDGIIGMGMPFTAAFTSPTLLQQLKIRGFTMEYSFSAGTANWNLLVSGSAVDEAMSSAYFFSPVLRFADGERKYWLLQVDDCRIPLPLPSASARSTGDDEYILLTETGAAAVAVFDTGSSVTAVPYNIYDKLIAEMCAGVTCVKNSKGSVFCQNCQESDFPSLEILFHYEDDSSSDNSGNSGAAGGLRKFSHSRSGGGSHKHNFRSLAVRLPPYFFTMCDATAFGGPSCELMLLRNPDIGLGPMWIFGDTFLSAQSSFFDLQRHRIGFCKSAVSNTGEPQSSRSSLVRFPFPAGGMAQDEDATLVPALESEQGLVVSADDDDIRHSDDAEHRSEISGAASGEVSVDAALATSSAVYRSEGWAALLQARWQHLQQQRRQEMPLLSADFSLSRGHSSSTTPLNLVAALASILVIAVVFVRRYRNHITTM